MNLAKLALIASLTLAPAAVFAHFSDTSLPLDDISCSSTAICSTWSLCVVTLVATFLAPADVLVGRQSRRVASGHAPAVLSRKFRRLSSSSSQTASVRCDQDWAGRVRGHLKECSVEKLPRLPPSAC